MDIVVPAAQVASLRMPARAVTDGTPDPVWADVPTSMWRFRRKPAQRLPLDAHTAHAVRRTARLAPWSLTVSLAAPALFAAGFFTRPELSFAGALLTLLWTLVESRTTAPDQLVSHNRAGDLRITGVPPEVAEEWATLNPGVTATNEPPARPHSKRFYATWSIGLLAASFMLALILANDGREDFLVLWMAAPALFIAAIVMAYKIEPPAPAEP
ncbi:hypothetical protein [Paractinoplanes deccanensis]|nr:hypothetical protein [Actinoplanes deccanensis]